MRIARTDVQKDIAAKAHVDQSTVSRWKTTDAPGKAESVAALARAYGRPVLEAFVEAKFLTATEAKARPAAAPDFTQLTNDELLELVRARMREEGEEHADGSAATKRRDLRSVQVAARYTGKPTAAQKKAAEDAARAAENIEPS